MNKRTKRKQRSKSKKRQKKSLLEIYKGLILNYTKS